MYAISPNHPSLGGKVNHRGVCDYARCGRHSAGIRRSAPSPVGEGRGGGSKTVEHRPCLHFNLNTLFTPRGFRAGNLAPLCQRFNPARPVVEKAKRMKAVAHFPHTVAVRQKRYPLPRKQRACIHHPSAPFDFSALPYAADDRLAIVFVWHDAPGVCARRRSVQGRWHRAANPSCMRSSLYSFINASRRIRNVESSSRTLSTPANHAFKLRCMRSCRPFCSGCPGLVRSTRMPKSMNCLDKRLNPPRLRAAKGAPLSLRMLQGMPFSANSRSNCGQTPA